VAAGTFRQGFLSATFVFQMKVGNKDAMMQRWSSNEGKKCALQYNGVARGKLQGGRRKGSGAGGEVRQSATELRRGGVERGRGRDYLTNTTSHHLTSRQQTISPIGRQVFFFVSSLSKSYCHKTTAAFSKTSSFHSFLLSFTLFFRALVRRSRPKRNLSILSSYNNQPFHRSMYSLCSDLCRSHKYYGKLP
jgi:hypothetical protein